MTARSLAVTSFVVVSLALAACGKEEEKPAAAAEAPAENAEATPAAEAAPLADSGDLSEIAAATRDYAESGCAAARRRLDFCKDCDGAEQKPLRDLLLANCVERESREKARELYEAIITNHQDTFAASAAIMHVRQIDAAELPPLGDYAGPKPTPVSRPQPAYPPHAEAANIDGRVKLRFDVREDGTIGNARVIESTPPLVFDAVALYAVTSWTYEPGQAAENQQISLRFDLDGSGDEAKPASGAAQ
ncbi:MAG: TonB family protein [Deltaproteobacteria bacterium]|nr:TonB family protein [Deltaproteobacteria bacterium]